ncbi:flp pilus-assembly TadE/G-like family protein [Nocardioides sp. zg-536]|uniref:Flp pilus-assembly TadE/G-like family protein n=1 Tax=Nocardioides faecalis TaxID=2803858 RepID=A0A938Y8C1_9ACTN|nr:Rv3654c family TadE-like protein [Nocardioides faecalis]MBM9461150.1 flp pilus-assembly TadE/G-like family protein [Nocardioides faecalis]MBS4752196.1 flp pilus-assembly TadE/G-like family protein [Nocardioides faecalis]QVI59003.1 flp pilus-assembly TadE/G-like family protein [Nocardioides faecalis]
MLPSESAPGAAVIADRGDTPTVPTGQRGAATVLVVAMCGVLLLVGAGTGVVAALVVAHRQAQGAADLAALAGATVLAEPGRGDPCGAAGEVAAANGAALVSCTVQGQDVLVEVSVAGPRWLGQVEDLRGEARAGPV